MTKKSGAGIIFSIFITLIFLFNDKLFAEPESVKGFSLVLSGGGSRGMAQIGVIKALEEEHLKPDLIVATSMGSIVGSFYASGYSSSFISQLAHEIDWTSVFSNSVKRSKQFVNKKNESVSFLWELQFDNKLKPILPNSISHGQSVYSTAVPYLTIPQYNAGMNFDSFPIPLRIVATDILTGNKAVFSKGNIATAIRASCAVPLAYSPVEYENMLLLDGGLSANIPVSTAKELRDGLIVAIDVTSPLWKKKDLDNPVHFVDQIVSLGIKCQKERDINLADIIIKPQLGDISNSDFSRIDTLISAGYIAMKKAIPSILARIKSTDTTTSNKPPSIHNASTSFCQQPISRSLKLLNNSIPVKSTSFSGNLITRSRLIKTASGIHEKDSLTPTSISKILTSVYSTNLFQIVNLDIDSNNNLKFIVEEKNYLRMRFGLRCDDFHLGEGYIQPAFENLFGAGICALLHIQYGLRREKYSLEFSADHLFTSNFANNILFKMYISKDRIFQREIVVNDSINGADLILLREHGLKKNGIVALIGTAIGKSTQFSTGVKIEQFKIQASVSDTIDSYSRMYNTLPYYLIKLNMDSMDKYPFPNSGMRHFLMLGGSGKTLFYNDFFINCAGSLGRSFTLGRRHTISPRIQFAWSTGSLPQTERSYLGGMIPEERSRELAVYNHIQFTGLEPRSLSGDIMALLHLDYRITIIKKFYANFSVDWGNVWERSEYSWKNAPRDFIKYAPVGIGIGLAYESLAGPIQLSFGQTVKSLNSMGIRTQPIVYFSAGHDF